MAIQQIGDFRANQGDKIREEDLDPSKDSKWVSANLGDITRLGNVLDAIQDATDSVNGVIDGLVEVVNIVVEIIELSQSLVSGVESLQAEAIDFAFKQLETIIKAVFDLIRQVFDFGLYVLPHYESFDLPKAIRNEIINPEGTGNKSLDAEDRIIRVPDKDDPTKTHFERVRRRGRAFRTDYDKFINDIVRSFDDVNDPLRPEFDASTKMSGVTIAIATNRLALFVAAYILLDALIRDGKGIIDSKGRPPQHSEGVAQAAVKMLNIALGQAETIGVTLNDEQDSELRVLRDTLLEQLGGDAGSSFREWLNALLGLFDVERKTADLDDDFSIDSIKFSGNSSAYNILYDEATATATNSRGISLNNIQGDTNATLDSPFGIPFNYTNFVTAEIDTKGSFELEVEAKFGNKSPVTYVVGRNQEKWRVAIPLAAVGGGYDAGVGDSLVSPDEFIGTMLYDFATNTISAFDPTLTAINTKFVPPTEVTFTFWEVSEGRRTDNVIQVLRYALPTFARFAAGNTTGTRRGIRDSYRHNLTFELDIDSSTRRKVSEYLGVSLSEIDRTFPLTSRTSSIDLTKFGVIERVSMRVIAQPQVQMNSSFIPRLIVNGTEQTEDDIKIRVRDAVMTYNTIELGDSSSVELQFISQIEDTIFFSNSDADNGDYMLYSDVQSFNIKKQGGLLGPPTITSGTKINVRENIFRFNTDGQGGGIVDDGSGNLRVQGTIDGLTGGPFVERFGETRDKFQTIYGDPRSGKKTLENGDVQEGETGSRRRNAENRYAQYRLTGRKARDTYAYAVVTRLNDTRQWVEAIGGFFSDENKVFDEDRSVIGGIGLAGNRFQRNLLLEWQENENRDESEYKIQVYQTTNKSAFTWLAQNTARSEEAFLSNSGMGQHQSQAAEVIVRVSNRNRAELALPPNWMTFNINSWFPIVDPVEERFSELLDILRESIPQGPYDSINDWLDITQDKIDNIVDIFEAIRSIINNINSILQIGGTGFWFLGIDSANGVEGFKERLSSVPVPDELRGARNVTGVQLIIPAELFGQEFGGDGRGLIGTLFNLPSGGTDSVRVPEKQSLRERLKDNTEQVKQTFKDAEEQRKLTRRKIKDLASEDLVEVNYQFEDLD